ncbi:hypothetical protein [Aminobacter sp. HY435]|uniref:hypothetical protein n=1 Tax=Aminobacter sp. HY435 TaxID=2970917 RepID=UPI0022B99EDD|nr:hypothetical protein [Aminobacter sp. HY435]
MVKLLPRLSGPPADLLLEEFIRGGAKTWSGFDADDLPDAARFAATGGSRVSAAELAEFRSGLVAMAQQHGFGADGGGRSSHAGFDASASAWLADHPLLGSGEALRDDVWAFVGVVVAPDIVHWRFGTSSERYHGGIRNTFQRLWMRGQALDRGVGSADRWHLVDQLTEDALVQITERPSIGGDAILASALAEAWVRGSKVHGRGAMEAVMRRAALRTRIWNELRTLSSLPRSELAAIMDEAMEISEAAEALPEATAAQAELPRPYETSAADLLSRVELIEAEAAGYGLLSPKSRSALNSLRSGFQLSESDRNALKHLIDRLRQFHAAQTSTNPISEARAAPKAESAEPVAKKRWSLWKKR